jgi:hypothetical protein
VSKVEIHLTKEELRHISYALSVTIGERNGIIPANEFKKLEELAEFINDAIKKWEM